MVNRITTANYYSSVLSDLMAAQNRENVANQQVATGKLGDDLKGFGNQTRNIIATNTVKARVDNMVGQLKNLTVKMNFQQASVEQISTVAAGQGVGQTVLERGGDGSSLMNSVQSFFSQATQALNTQYGGDYIFSGGQTQTQPFTATSLSALTTGSPLPAVSTFFQNGSLAPTSQVDDNTSFQSIEAFQQSAPGNFNGPLTDAQQTFLTGAITQLANVVTSTTQNSAQGGDMQAQVTAAATTQTDRQTTLKSSLGDMTDVNEADAAAALTQAQTAVQASAQVFMTLKSMSLLNYLAPGG
jgi:flagellar hook-associated protein 3 FlgL